jgi:hypothetical protein
MGAGGVWLIIGAAGVAAIYLWYATIIRRRNKGVGSLELG